MIEKYFGKYRGKVKEVDTSSGNIKVVVPAILEETEIWAEPCFSYVGEDYGIIFLPEKDDVVWIEFIDGELDSAIWSGVWLPWKKDLPAEVAKAKVIKTKTGHLIELNEKEKYMKLRDCNGNEIKMEKDKVTVKDSVGNLIEMTSAQMKVVPKTLLILGDGIQFCNNLSNCIFTGAPHFTQTKVKV